MSNFTFEIKTPLDLLLKLNQEFNDFKKDPTSTRHALNFSFTAWHLTDWDFEVNHKSKKGKHENKGDLRESLYIKCPNLKILHDISIRIKHYIVSEQKSNLKSTNKHIGPFDQTFGSSFDTTRLEVYLDNGECKLVEDIFQNIYNFWNEYYKLN